MLNYSRKIYHEMILRAVFIVVGIAINVLVSLTAYHFDLPVFLDTIGTILVSGVAGFFPGILTAVMTNVVFALFNSVSMYFGVTNALVAILTAWLVRNRDVRSVRIGVEFIILAGFITGEISAIIQWWVLGGPQSQTIAEAAKAMADFTGFNTFWAFSIVNVIVNIIDKGLCVFIALRIFHIIPEDKRTLIKNAGWRQTPLSDEDRRILTAWSKDTKYSLGRRVTSALLGLMLILIIIMGGVGVQLYFKRAYEDRKISTMNAAKFAAEIVDADNIEAYIKNGEKEPGYKETEDMLYKIRENAFGVEYLYVIRISRIVGDEEFTENKFVMKKLTVFPGWDVWKETNKVGLECSVSITKKGGKITLVTENLGIAIENVTTILDASKDVYVALTGDEVALTDIRIR